MKFTIISPIEQQEFIISWLKAHTPQGDFVVQPGHAPTIVMLAPNKEITFNTEQNEEKSITIKNGILKIERQAIILIVI